MRNLLHTSLYLTIASELNKNTYLLTRKLQCQNSKCCFHFHVPMYNFVHGIVNIEKENAYCSNSMDLFKILVALCQHCFCTGEWLIKLEFDFIYYINPLNITN